MEAVLIIAHVVHFVNVFPTFDPLALATTLNPDT